LRVAIRRITLRTRIASATAITRMIATV